MKTYLILVFITLSFLLMSQVEANTINHYFFNGLEINFIIAMSLWAVIGMFINLVSDVLRRKPKSTSSPRYISISYWWKDNYKRLILSILMIPIAIIGFDEFTDVELTIAGAIAVGFWSDHVIEIIKRKIPKLQKDA